MTELQAQLSRLRIIQSLRFTVLVIAILVTSALLGLSTGIMSIVPAIVLVLFLRDETLNASFALLVGILLGAAIVLLTSMLWSNVPLLFLVTSLVAIFVMSYVAAQGVRGRNGLVAFAVGAEICLLSALFAEISGAAGAVEAVYVWSTELPVGVLLLWIILLGLWPSPTAKDLIRLVEASRRECAILLRQTIKPVAEARPVGFVPSRIGLKLLGELGRTVKLNATKLQHGPESLETMNAQVDCLSQISANIRYIQRTFSDLPGEGLTQEARQAAVEIMTSLSDRLDGEPATDMTAAFAVLDREEQRYALRWRTDETARRLAARLSGFTVTAKALEGNIDAFDHPEAWKTIGPVDPAETGSAPHLMLDSLQAALKIVIGVLIGVLVFMLTGLPASGYLVIAILVVLVQPNLGRAHLRFRLWFPGVLFGSAWALVGIMVLSMVPHFAVYLAWLLPGLFLAGYLGLGPDRISYVGIQLAAAMVVILGMTVYPVNNVISAETRVVGAVVGFLIALSVYHFLWPVHPARLLRENMVRNLHGLIGILARLSRHDAAQLDARDEAELHREIATLKLQIQANVSLLYDISYMMTERVRPAYDYFSLTHQSALIFIQLWCLQQALFAADVNRRQHILAPLQEVEAPLAHLLSVLADGLDKGRSLTAQEIRQSMVDISAKMETFLDQAADSTDPNDQRDMTYGANTLSVINYHIGRLANAMDTAHARHVLRTGELAHLYEAAE
ncbi:MAG: FUSC family protein [Pseudomonadota bacterium]